MAGQQWDGNYLFYYFVKAHKMTESERLQYIAALERKYAEQVSINHEMAKELAAQMEEIIRLENQIYQLQTKGGLDGAFPIVCEGGQA